MRFYSLLVGLLSGWALVSCQGAKTGVGGTDYLADNGGFSEGNFYGDPSTPPAAGYPRDGETFATSSGVPFRHNDPVVMDEPVVEPPAVPVAAGQPVTPTLATTPRWTRVPARSATRVSADDRYEQAYPTADEYRGDHGAEVAIVTPYVEPKPIPPPAPAVAAKPAGSVSAGRVAGTASGGSKKSSASPGATAAKAKPAAKVAAAKSSGAKGKTIKTVQVSAGKKGTSAKSRPKVVRVHDVKRGDTLTKLANRYGVSVAHLKAKNKLPNDTIVVGKRLSID